MRRTMRSNAVWTGIARALEHDILSGACLPGERLPTEQELAGRFRVNRHTVRRAVAALREKGLLRVEQGRGTFVHDRVIPYTVTRCTRFSENMTLQKRAPGGVLLNAGEEAADDEVSQGLHVALGRAVLRLDILREADCRPLGLASHYFPLPRFAGLADVFREVGSVTACLRAFGAGDFRRVSTRLSARLPTCEEARLLQQPKSTPLMVARSVNVDSRGVPVDYGVTRYSGPRVEFVFHTG
ncbi:transcriptional regulator, GntR family with UTRA sensor domain containing protein [Desulfovibrio sp. X2]|uniref:phosphonate metabolism transcriptional regulator PhnF n=1 Tax=Desulfovibrio sp. X2 TaxID=941449 RepID=UPI000358B2F6|nr:phosphonate metabolism transcriptional regulator PhnF [Desulfovibrio sp. X2]EPR43831.1 transcriptional regulator, GntR family with UTRA sensor domain containing protein [Desulfovibrio sp. X2]